jgi:metallophosphoesterase (TIGR00282 family)
VPRTFTILALGDVVGRPGRAAMASELPGLVKEVGADFVIANAENAAAGSGLTPKIFADLRAAGIDAMTLGDHCFKRNEIAATLASSERLVRPGNLSASAPGKPYRIVTAANGMKVAFAALLGRVYMNQLPADNPFDAADAMLSRIGKGADVIVFDLHCEATSEKLALGYHLDGRASLCFGTHTHVPTADAKILPGGTAHITDVGMCGPYDSILGRDRQQVVATMRTNVPGKFEVATGDVRLCGVVAEIDLETKRAVRCERVEKKAAFAGKAYDGDDRR